VNTFVIEEFFVDEKNACNFYTVRVEDRDTSETDLFYDQFEEHADFKDDFGIINALIGELGVRGMRLIRRVRDESKAFALPPESLIREAGADFFENKLRLYYVPLSQNIVVLLGGGIAHEYVSAKPPTAFWDAQIFAKKILDARNDAYFIDGNRLLSTDNEYPIIIY